MSLKLLKCFKSVPIIYTQLNIIEIIIHLIIFGSTLKKLIFKTTIYYRILVKYILTIFSG